MADQVVCLHNRIRFRCCFAGAPCRPYKQAVSVEKASQRISMEWVHGEHIGWGTHGRRGGVFALSRTLGRKLLGWKRRLEAPPRSTAKANSSKSGEDAKSDEQCLRMPINGVAVRLISATRRKAANEREFQSNNNRPESGLVRQTDCLQVSSPALRLRLPAAFASLPLSTLRTPLPVSRSFKSFLASILKRGHIKGHTVCVPHKIASCKTLVLWKQFNKERDRLLTNRLVHIP